MSQKVIAGETLTEFYVIDCGLHVVCHFRVVGCYLRGFVVSLRREVPREFPADGQNLLRVIASSS